MVLKYNLIFYMWFNKDLIAGLIILKYFYIIALSIHCRRHILCIKAAAVSSAPKTK